MSGYNMKGLAVEDVIELYDSIHPALMEACRVLFDKWIIPCETLYHYTDTNALINGLINDGGSDDKKICMWASDWKFQNDKLERIIGLKVLELKRQAYLIEDEVGYTVLRIMNKL